MTHSLRHSLAALVALVSSCNIDHQVADDPGHVFDAGTRGVDAPPNDAPPSDAPPTAPPAVTCITKAAGQLANTPPTDSPLVESIPPPLGVIASGQDDPRRLVMDRRYLYWVNHGVDVFGNGAIMRIPKTGGDPEVVAANQNVPEGLVVDDQAIYWTNRGDANGQGQLVCAAKVGGTPRVLVSGLDWPVELVQDSQYVYWTNWSTSEIWRFPKAGGQRELVATPDGKVMNGIAVDDRQAYVGTEATATTPATVVGFAKAGGGAPTVMGPIADSVLTYLAVDDSYVYWTNYIDGSVRRVAKAGGTPEALFTGLYDVRYTTIVGETVYFAQYSNAGMPRNHPAPGGIRKVPRMGGPVTTLIEGGQGYWGIAVDDTTVYFTNQQTGTVSAVAR
jgi:hypothetical protein